MSNKKKRNILLPLSICMIILLLGSVAFWQICYDGLYFGMNQADYIAEIPENDRFDYLSYSFYEKESGGMLVHFDISTNTIDELRYYPGIFIDKSHEAFSKIKKGMTLYEVVSYVGVPTKTITSGVISTVFQADDGSQYCVFWSKEDGQNGNELKVSKVEKTEDRKIGDG